MARPFLYATLPSATSIRLLRLHPGVGDESISCSLEVIDDFRAPARYYALSYCWGDKNDRTELSCNGEAFAVTKNLYAALHRLRQKGLPYPFWVDAICINQGDISERNQQVSIMNKIYQHASSVFIWIGPGNEDLVEVMAMIQKIAHRIYDSCDPGCSMASWLSTLPAENDKLNVIGQAYKIKPTDFSSTNWQSFWHFYQAGWFFRVWVIQEVRQQLNVLLLCGDSEIAWSLVGLSASWAWSGAIQDWTTHWKKEYFPSYDSFINTNFMWDQALSTRRQAPFLAILHLARPFRSTDPRDKVFAMLHHCITQHVMDEHGHIIERRFYPFQSQNISRPHLDIRADYRMNVYQVYREVALQCLQQYQSLEVLCYAWQTTHYDTDWPSWIPRWNIPNNHVIPVILPFLYNAARGLGFDYRLNPTLDSLYVQGLKLGSIVETTSVLKYQRINSQETGNSNSIVENKLLAILKLITQDCWEMDSEITATRSQYNLQAHFANFSSYILRLLESRKVDCYISLYSVWCEYCGQYISSLRGDASSTPSRFYHCNICRYGDFDLCTACYEQKGKRCEVPNHVLRKLDTTSVWIPYTSDVVEILKAHAANGKYELFLNLLKLSCRRAAFFKAFPERYGTASVLMKPGDIIVILFGSRVPFVLRKLDSMYRLVSDCYVQGLMDGEAIDMWKNGELELEEFEIR